MLQHGQVRGAALSEKSPYPPELPGPWSACSKTHVPDSNSLRGRDRSPSGPSGVLVTWSAATRAGAGSGAFGDIALPPELAGPWPVCSKTRVPDSNSLRGRDRSPSGPSGVLVTWSAATRAGAGSGAFGEIALPPELAGPWPACSKPPRSGLEQPPRWGPISERSGWNAGYLKCCNTGRCGERRFRRNRPTRSEEHTSELQSRI